MIVYKRKDRMLSIRLSQEEYEMLQRASLASRARSVSDFARDTIFQTLGEPAVATRVAQLATELETVTRDLQQLRAQVAKP